MIIEPNGNATAAEIDTFRTALAVATAIYRHNQQEYKLASQLITDPNDFVCALQAIINLLLQVIDQTDNPITGETVLDGFRSAAALSVPNDQ